MFELYFADINIVAVFGAFLGIYLIVSLDSLVRNVMTFIKGWRSG